MQNDPKINTANTDWNESGGNKVRLLTRYNLRPVNGESNDAINQAKGELDRIMDKMVQYRRNRLEVAEEDSDADDERPERVDDDGIIDPDVVNDHRHRGRIRPTKEAVDVPSKKEVDRLQARFTKLALDIFTEAPKLTDRTEGVLEGIKGEIMSLTLIFDKLFPKQPEERMKELTMVEIDGDPIDLEDCLLSWKRDIASIVYDAKARQQKEVQDRKGKQMEAMTILKSRLIPELSKTSGYLDWIEGVRTVLEKVQGYTSDLLIADTLKKSLNHTITPTYFMRTSWHCP